MAVKDFVAAVDPVRADKLKVTREQWPVKGGSSLTAFGQNPTGYKLELMQSKKRD